MFAIAAISRNRVIGQGGRIPWHIPEEFRWFRSRTYDSVVIMGRRTFESLPKLLVGRVNIVLTRNPVRLRNDEHFTRFFGEAAIGAAAHRLAGVHQLSFRLTPRTELRLARGLESLARSRVTKFAWLCGGAQVYEQFLGDCSDLYLSVIDREVEGDAFFPPFEHLFDCVDTVAHGSEFKVLHYRRNSLRAAPQGPVPGLGSRLEI